MESLKDIESRQKYSMLIHGIISERMIIIPEGFKIYIPNPIGYKYIHNYDSTDLIKKMDENQIIPYISGNICPNIEFNSTDENGLYETQFIFKNKKEQILIPNLRYTCLSSILDYLCSLGKKDIELYFWTCTHFIKKPDWLNGNCQKILNIKNKFDISKKFKSFDFEKFRDIFVNQFGNYEPSAINWKNKELKLDKLQLGLRERKNMNKHIMIKPAGYSGRENFYLNIQDEAAQILNESDYYLQIWLYRFVNYIKTYNNNCSVFHLVIQIYPNNIIYENCTKFGDSIDLKKFYIEDLMPCLCVLLMNNVENDKFNLQAILEKYEMVDKLLTIIKFLNDIRT